MIRIKKVVSGRYTAVAHPPCVNEFWSADEPLAVDEIIKELTQRGAHQTDIGDAFFATDPEWVSVEGEFSLRFVEGFHDEKIQECWRVKRIAIGPVSDCLLVRLHPGLPRTNYGVNDSEIRYLVLSPKYEGFSLSPVSSWPMWVWIYLPLVGVIESREFLTREEVRKIAIGKIYRGDEVSTQAAGPYIVNPW